MMMNIPCSICDDGINIPKDIAAIKELSITEKILLSEIVSQKDKPEGCIVTTKVLADALCVTPITINKSMRKLEDLGYIYRIRDGHIGRSVYLNTNCKFSDAIPNARSMFVFGEVNR